MKKLVGLRPRMAGTRVPDETTSASTTRVLLLDQYNVRADKHPRLLNACNPAIQLFLVRMIMITKSENFYKHCNHLLTANLFSVQECSTRTASITYCIVQDRKP